MGLLTIPVKERLNTKVIQAYSPNESDREVLRLLDGASDITLVPGDPLALNHKSSSQFDAIVACIPWGLAAKTPLEVRVGSHTLSVADDYGHLLILASCQHLSEKGIGVFVVPNSFFFASGRSGKARHTLEQLGIRLTAAIELPAGTFQPFTGIPTHIVVLQRTTDETLFAGKYSPDLKHQEALLKNIREGKEGESPSLGRIVPSETFKGYSPIEMEEKLVEQSRRMGLVGYPFREVVTEVNRSAKSQNFEGLLEKPNSVYLPEMATTSATMSQEALPERLKSYYQLVVDPEVADAAFVAKLLNTSFGQLWRDSLRSGTTIPRIGKSQLEASTLYLPPKAAKGLQRQVIDCDQHITRLISELKELGAQLWKRPTAIDKVTSSLRTVNREERFQDWIDTLPFPLASILWVCHAQAGSYREQYERKIHFFEALAEFLAIVHMSAFVSHLSTWSDLKKRFHSAMTTASLSLERATFGTWVVLVEVLSAETRRVLEKEPEWCFELFKTQNRKVLEAVSFKRIVSAVKTANKIRNDWIGHTGAVRDANARAVNEQLIEQISTVRETFGVVWEEYELVLPGSCKMRQGIWDYTVKKVMGSRTPFPSENVELTEGIPLCQHR